MWCRPSFLIRLDVYTAFRTPKNQDFPIVCIRVQAKTLPSYSNSILSDVWPKRRRHNMALRPGNSSARERLPPQRTLSVVSRDQSLGGACGTDQGRLPCRLPAGQHQPEATDRSWTAERHRQDCRRGAGCIDFLLSAPNIASSWIAMGHQLSGSDQTGPCNCLVTSPIRLRGKQFS